MANPQTQVRSVDQKVTIRSGGAPEQTNKVIEDHDLVADGDVELSADDIGGASLIVASLESEDGIFSVEMDVLDDNGNVVRTRNPGIWTDVSEINERTVPVPADDIVVRVTDSSGGSQNVVNGSINIHSGGPSSVLVLDEDGFIVEPRSEEGVHRTGADEDIVGGHTVESMPIPNRPDSIRLLVSGADGDFDVKISFNNTSVTFSGGNNDPVDVERAIMSNDTVDVTITDTSGSANTVNYDILVV